MSSSLQPAGAPGLTVLSAEGEPIARRGAIMAEPVDVTRLPPYVGQAFVAMEDRRFFRHVGIDPWGIARAMWRNLRAGRVREGGSTISQQLAKTSFLTPDRTWGRKAQEAVITLWLEARLSKEEILSRYLSNVYFGDNVYGLRAAARHYFNTTPEELTLSQAAMLAGVVNAPSRLAPTINLDAARRRARPGARRDAGGGLYQRGAAPRARRPARVRRGPRGRCPDRHLFRRLDRAAGERARPKAPMANGRSSRRSTAISSASPPASSAAPASAGRRRRWSRCGSTAGWSRWSAAAITRAARSTAPPRRGASRARRSSCSSISPPCAPATGRTRSSTTRRSISPAGGRAIMTASIAAPITLRDAFAMSSNSVAVQLQERVGRDAVIRAARDLGVTSDLRPDADAGAGLERR